MDNKTEKLIGTIELIENRLASFKKTFKDFELKQQHDMLDTLYGVYSQLSGKQPVVAYRSFQSSEEFEIWQRENPTFKISQVSPFPKQIGMNTTINREPNSLPEDHQTVGGVEMEVIVTYLKYPSGSEL